MKNCFQSSNQNMFQHGLNVFRYTQKLINANLENLKLPSWYSKYSSKLLENIYDFKTIKHYTIWHDVSKPFVKTVDENGKIHYPDHANKSANIFRDSIRNDINIVSLIRNDMIFHSLKYEEILSLKLPFKTICTLLISALAELHANAELFGTTSSESFIIKFKRLEKLGNKICRYYFEKAYVYIITRTDLPHPAQIVQSSHAAAECGRNFIKPNDEHPSFVLCSAKNEDKLKSAIKYLHDNNIKFITFREPDLDNSLTSLATEPLVGERRKLMKKFQLIK